MNEIMDLTARQVYTNRGFPGIEARVITTEGICEKAICTSGVSIGTHEIKFQFDGGLRFHGKGVKNAAKVVQEVIGPELKGMDITDQANIDTRLLEIAVNSEKRIGGNAIAAVSAAVLKAGAASRKIPLYQYLGGEDAVTLPVPGVAMVNGDSRYGGGITTPGDKPTMSVMCFGFDSFSEASYACWDIHDRWLSYTKQKFGGHANIRDYVTVPSGVYDSDVQIWHDMTELLIKAGYEGKAGLQMDVATDTYYDPGDRKYHGLFDYTTRTKEQLLDYYEKIIREYPFVIIEDPFNEDDYDMTAELTRRVNIQIVGDDLFTTNPERVRYGISKGAANTVLLKVNQIGTISRALAMVSLAYENGYGIMPSDSRGEGAAIADYAVGIKAGTIRESGIGDRANRFLEIEEELGSRAKFAGKDGITRGTTMKK